MGKHQEGHMSLRDEIVDVFKRIDVQKGLGVSPDEAADIIVNMASNELYSDNVQKYIDERIAALEMVAQRQRANRGPQVLRTIEIHQAIDPIIRASAYARRARP
jgi:hypothetical protein